MSRHGYYYTTGTGPDLMENARNAVRDMGTGWPATSS